MGINLLSSWPHSCRLFFKGRPIAQGELSNPGVVPRAIQHVFDIIEKTPGRDFLLRLSMMEIYNEVRLAAELAATLANGDPASRQITL